MCLGAVCSSGAANCAALPTFPQILRPGSLLPPPSKDLTAKPNILREKNEISVVEKYNEIVLHFDRTRVDKEKGEIYFTTLPFDGFSQV